MITIKQGSLVVALLSIAAMLGGCVGAQPEDDGAADDESTGEATSALASDCERGANGFVDISDRLSGTVRRNVEADRSLTITLQTATIAGAQRGFAKISGPTLRGDMVWMNWSLDGGHTTRVQCGPFAVDGTNLTKTSAAKITNPSSLYVFQACGAARGSRTACTSWF